MVSSSLGPLLGGPRSLCAETLSGSQVLGLQKLTKGPATPTSSCFGKTDTETALSGTAVLHLFHLLAHELIAKTLWHTKQTYCLLI